jgi:hypothetical protein
MARGGDRGREPQERAYQDQRRERLGQMRGHLQHMQDACARWMTTFASWTNTCATKRRRARGGTGIGTTLRTVPSANCLAVRIYPTCSSRRTTSQAQSPT